ncbi:MAG: hypothetical protein JW983_07685 [Elusimicrobia bacterium]|nr:hypothetical protein [Elusimicrobiota bacterium]
MRFLKTLCVLLLCVSAVYAESGLFSLNGKWKYIKTTSEDESIPSFRKAKKMYIPSNWFLKGSKRYPGEKGLDYSGTIWFKKDFKVPKDFKGKKVILCFDMVDYFTDVFVNNVKVGSHAGCFQPFYFDITDNIKFGEKNELAVRVDSPAEKQNLESDEDPGWPRKQSIIKGVFGYHDARPGGTSEDGQKYGTGGIVGDVYLKGVDNLYMENVRIEPYLKDNYTKAELVIKFKVNSYGPGSTDRQLFYKITPYNFQGNCEVKKEFKEPFSAGINEFSITETIENPELWWSWDHGKQNLYKFELFERTGENSGKPVYCSTFGIREIKIGKDWVWTLNGKKIFIKGSNYISTQWLSQMDRKKYAKDIDMMIDANLNAIRVHAHVEKKDFYRLCDEKGVIVWQDFVLQWGYTDKADFIKEAVRQEQDMIELLFNHPSIFVWCCHNESPWAMHWMQKDDADQNKLLDEALEKKAKEIDKTRYTHMASGLGDGHPYEGWYGGAISNYKSLPGEPFITEYGAQAIPVKSTVLKMFSGKTLFPQEDADWAVWKFHDFQKDVTFNTAKINMGNSIDEFIRNSQDYQAILVKYATEVYRRAMWSRMTGMFHFMFIDCWPSITWSVVDYYRKPKKGYYALQTAFQPVMPSAEYSLDLPPAKAMLWVINDTYRAYPGSVLYAKLIDKEKKVKEKWSIDVDIPANQAVYTGKEIFGLEAITTDDAVLELELKDKDGNLLGTNYLDKSCYSAKDYEAVENARKDAPVIKSLYVKKEIVLDGGLDDWQKNESARINPEHSLENGEFTGDTDIQVEMYSAWDKTNLYFAFDITDNEVINERIVSDIWQEDCIEIFINPDNQGLIWGNEKDYQIGVAPGSKQYAWFQKTDALDYVKVAVKESKTGYTAEVKIPWDFLKTKPGPDKVIGFSPAIHDLDNQDGTSCKLNWYFKSPGIILGKLILTK